MLGGRRGFAIIVVPPADNPAVRLQPTGVKMIRADVGKVSSGVARAVLIGELSLFAAQVR